MSDLCNDNRFELIEKYKKELIEATNIETAPDEMKVLDDILFRFWQMGWLDKLELSFAQPEPIKINIEDFNKEDWERLKKEWGNTPITVLPAQPDFSCDGCKTPKHICGICMRNYPNITDHYCAGEWAERREE